MTQYFPIPICAAHDVAEFACGGEESLDTYLRNEAVTAHERGAARTHVWLTGNRVVAYYTLFPQTIATKSIPRKAREGFGSGVPGFTIGKLALDASLRRQGYGRLLLTDALTSVVSAADQVGGRIIMVEAVDNNAFDFYRAEAFNEIEASYEMWMFVASAREALALA